MVGGCFQMVVIDMADVDIGVGEGELEYVMAVAQVSWNVCVEDEDLYEKDVDHALVLGPSSVN